MIRRMLTPTWRQPDKAAAGAYRLLFSLLVGCGVLCAPERAVRARGDEAADAHLKKLSDESRARAEHLRVQVAAAGQATKATLHPVPLMKYTDVPRQIEMATLWVWHDEGRPV